MNNEIISVEEKFYQDVADLLGVSSTFQHNVNKVWRTRWNNRKPGNGRFEGFGLIRFFGPNAIHIAINFPIHAHKICTSSDEALHFIKNVLTDHS